MSAPPDSSAPRPAHRRIRAVVPVLDEAVALRRLLPVLAAEVDEVVVVDGGSGDGSVAVARGLGAEVRRARRGRGPQLDAGATVGEGVELLWFVHADAGVPAGAGDALRRATARWGCFAVELDDPDPRLRLTGAAMTLRARRTGSCTGDMGIWIRPDLLASLGGFGELPAFEDLSLSDRARRAAPWQVLGPPLRVDPRRWRDRGVTRTILRLWLLRAGYRLGLPPELLSRGFQPSSRGPA